MKILSLKRHHYAARVTILLMMVSLIAGMVGCGGGGGGESYTLTIDSTAGGIIKVNNVTIPGKAMSTYDPGTVVSLSATPDADYRFARWIGDVSTVANTTTPITTITMSDDYNITACFQADFMVSTGLWHTVGLKSDGTVVAVGFNDTEGTFGVNLTWLCDVGNWTDITQVSTGWLHTVGLRADGTVVAVGANFTEMVGFNFSWYDVGNWTNITQVSVSPFPSTLGLKSDGTVVAVIANYNYTEIGINLYDVLNWTDIAQVSAGFLSAVGLKSDGTVVAVGPSEGSGLDYGQCNVGNWTGIVQASAGLFHTVGLKSDGTVVAVGDNSYGQCDVSNWTDIVQVAAGNAHTVGLRSDGTVVALGDNSYGQCDVGNWTDIIQVATAGGEMSGNFSMPFSVGHTVGLRSDGTVVAVGLNDQGQCGVGGWNLN
jgi:alpha-tubulin suppressor-like RCC1 family protein